MPYLKIETNCTLDKDQEKKLLQTASAKVAEGLGKPERYVMVRISSGNPMLFGGSDAPLAYLELKSIGLPDSATSKLSHMLCDLMQEHLDLKSDRVYIEFANAERHMWGWNGGTF